MISASDGKPVKNKGFGWMKSVRLNRVTRTSSKTTSTTHILPASATKESVKSEELEKK